MKERQQNSSDAFKKEQNRKGVVKAGNNFLLTFFGGLRIDKVKIHKHGKIILQLVFHGHIFPTNYLYMGIDTYIFYIRVCANPQFIGRVKQCENCVSEF